MAAVELFTVVVRQAIALVAVPLILVIGYSKIFGKTPPAWSAFALLGLILLWLVLWIRSTVRLIRQRRAAPTS